jgi:hypothetical protein
MLSDPDLLKTAEPLIYIIIIYKRPSSVQQEVFTHRHDRHQTSVNKAVAKVVEVRWLMKKSQQVPHIEVTRTKLICMNRAVLNLLVQDAVRRTHGFSVCRLYYSLSGEVFGCMTSRGFVAGGRRMPPSIERLWRGELRKAHVILILGNPTLEGPSR